MVIDLIIRLIQEANQRSQQAQQEAVRQRAAAEGIPMAMPVEPGPKKKKKKKKQRREESVEGPQRPRQEQRTAAPAEEAPVHAAASTEATDPRRLFVLSEIIGPPVALRDEEDY